MTQNEIIGHLKIYSVAKIITDFYDFIPDDDEESATAIVDELRNNGTETTEDVVKYIQSNCLGWGSDYVADKVYELIDQL